MLGIFQIFNTIVSSTIGVIISGIFQQNFIYDSLSNYINITSEMQATYIAMLIIMETLSSIVFFTNGQLIIFHVFLACKKKTTYEYIIAKRKEENKYKVSNIIVINEREIIEEIPLEEVFEPYIENTQFQPREYPLEYENSRIVPENFAIPPISNSASYDEKSETFDKTQNFENSFSFSNLEKPKKTQKFLTFSKFSKSEIIEKEKSEQIEK